MMFRKEELIRVCGAHVIKDCTPEGAKYTVSTDTRTIKSGDIYLPLRGENFDGENFIKNAIDNGCRAYFTAHDTNYENADLILKVADTKEAYLKIAHYYREKINPIVIGVTGSSGKTTTKEMIYAVLNQKFKTHKTFSNHNNEIGFCETVLSMPEETEVLIVEAGMRGLGEIELISKYLTPDYAIITNCGSAHVGRLGSLDNIAEAKCEIASGLKSQGVFLAKNQEITKKHLKFAGEKIFYSVDDVKILEIAPSYSKFEYKGNIYELNVEGEYNIENALSSIEIGLKTGMTLQEITRGLSTYRPIEKRWEIEEINGLKFINDSYNANPDSMKAACKAFVELYKKPVLVLGDMGELGENERDYHKETGEFLSKFNTCVKYILVGNLACEIGKPLENKGFDVVYFEDNKQAARYIIENLDESYTIFLKASRFMKFEEILEYVKRGIFEQ